MQTADLQAILDATMDIVCVFDSERRFVTVNDAACAHHNATREQLIGHKLDEFIGRRTRRGRLEGLPDPRADRARDAAQRLGGRGQRPPDRARGARDPALRPGPPPVRPARRHRAARARGAAAPGPEDGGGRPARGRDRARLQQPADGDLGLRRDRPPPDRRRPGLGRAGRDAARRRARGRPHPPAAGVRAPPGARARAARRQRRRRRPRADARAPDRRGHRDRDARRRRPPARARRPRAARAGGDQPRDQRARRDARRRHAGDRDRRPRRATCGSSVSDTGTGHRARGPRAHLRAVLHHQGRRLRHRPRAGDRARDRHAVRRARRGHLAAGDRLDVHGPPAGRARRPRRRSPSRPSNARRSAAPRPCCCARTRTPCASSSSSCSAEPATPC